MPNLQIEFFIAAIVLLILILRCLAKNRMSIRHSIAWLSLPLIFILIAIFPTPLEIIANWLGFETLANFLFVIIIAMLILICFFLTISSSHQQEQITKLNQEISLLKQRHRKNK